MGSAVLFLRLPHSPPDATIWCSMIPANPQLNTASRPRVGIPWRTSVEEDKAATTGLRGNTQDYVDAIEEAGGQGIPISLKEGDARKQLISELDAFVLPGSPADIDPALYHAARSEKTHDDDPNREKTDFAILEHAFASGKPVLAICYGCQSLNVHLKGTLVQDIRTKNPEALAHGHTDLPPEERKGDARHPANLTPGSQLASLNRATRAEINSSHHQAIDQPGEKLRVTAHAPDGTIEGVEWTGDSNWVVGVQWHPERMPEDPFAQRLFQQFVAAARAHEAVAHKT